MKILTTTWTKWKTTITRLLNYILIELGYKTLSADSEKVVLNWKQIFNKNYSNDVYWLVPSKCPWRFLYLWYNKKDKKMDLDYAIFEAVIWCYWAWLWYHLHDIGIFTNIFEDHIGPWGALDRQWLADRKRFFISKIKKNWYIIYNWDEPLIVEKIKNSNIENKIIFTKNIKTYISNDSSIFIENWIIKLKFQEKEFIFNFNKSEFTFYWKYNPALINISFVLWWLLTLIGLDVFIKNEEKIYNIIKTYKPDIFGWRMYLINKSGRNIIIDYAQEKQSLRELLTLSSKLKTNWSKNIIVLKVSPWKMDNVYEEIWEDIGDLADKFIVYDKVDGVEIKTYITKNRNIVRQPWEVMKLLSSWLVKKNKNVEEVIYRKDAIRKALKISNPWDVIVIIVNDPEKTWKFMKRLWYF